jgi:hypothetical protein
MHGRIFPIFVGNSYWGSTENPRCDVRLACRHLSYVKWRQRRQGWTGRDRTLGRTGRTPAPAPSPAHKRKGPPRPATDGVTPSKVTSRWKGRSAGEGPLLLEGSSKKDRVAARSFHLIRSPTNRQKEVCGDYVAEKTQKSKSIETSSRQMGRDSSALLTSW